MKKVHEVTLYDGLTVLALCPDCEGSLSKAGHVKNRYSKFQRFNCPRCKTFTYMCVWKDPDNPRPFSWGSSDKRTVPTKPTEEKTVSVNYSGVSVRFTLEEIARLDKLLKNKGREPRYTSIIPTMEEL